VRRRIVQNPFTILFLFYLLAFGVFFFYSIFTFPGYLATFLWSFAWTNSFMLFMRYCIPVTVAAVAVAYSLLPAADTLRMRSGREPFAKLVSSHLTTFIVLTVVYTALILGLYPLAVRNMERFASLTREARIFEEKAEAALEEGDRDTALLNYQRYLAIDKGNRKTMEVVSDLQEKMIDDRPEPPQEVQQDLESTWIRDLAEGREAYELLEMAEKYFEREDYFSANYYANLAFQIDPSREDARRLAARAQDKITSKDLSSLEVEEKRLYERKKEGYEYFSNGDFFKAYDVFRELRDSYPRDADVISYLNKSVALLSRETFFLDEAQRIDTLPGATELLFVNYRDEEEREIVFIGKLAGTDAGIFCKEIEVLRFNDQGLLYHYYAPYGKLRDGTLYLHGVDRFARDRKATPRETVPRYLSGASRLRREPLPYMLSLGPTLEQLPTLKGGRAASASAESLGFFALWQARRQISSYGYLEPTISAEILRRLLLPFSFLVLCLLSVAVGWRFQARFFGRPHWVLVLFMPLFPIVAISLTALYLHAQRILLDFVLLRLRFSISLIVFLVLQGLLLLITVIILAGQRAD
jgi:lipopolysaccharide export LptBFGC system permease protein LptF